MVSIPGEEFFKRGPTTVVSDPRQKTAPPEEEDKFSFFESFGNKIGGAVLDEWQGATEKIGGALKDAANMGNPLRAGLRIASGAASAVNAPFTGLFKAGANAASDALSDIPAVQRAATSRTGDAVATITTKAEQVLQKYPEATEDITDLINVFGTVLGLEGMRGVNLGNLNKQVSTGVGADAKKVVTAAKDSGARLYKSITEQNPKDIDLFITEKFEKGVRPSVSGKGTAAQRNIYQDNSIRAVKKIVENKKNLELVDQYGELKSGKVPETLHEFSHAVEQTKKRIFEQYNALQKASGDAGAKLDLRGVSDELIKIADDPVLNDLHPEVANYAKTRLEAFTARKVYTPEQAQSAITNLNKSLEAFYKNPSYETASRASVDALIANKMREGLDDLIANTTSSGYQDLKQDYGALKSIEKDVVHRAIVDARKNTKGLIDFTDVFSGSDVVQGVLAFDPTTFAGGVAKKAIAEYIKFRNNPNTAIKQLFQGAEKAMSAPVFSPERIMQEISVSASPDGIGGKLAMKDLTTTSGKLKPEVAIGRINDIAKKLDIAYPDKGFGEAFRKVINQKSTTFEELKAAATEIINNAGRG